MPNYNHEIAGLCAFIVAVIIKVATANGITVTDDESKGLLIATFYITLKIKAYLDRRSAAKLTPTRIGDTVPPPPRPRS